MLLPALLLAIGFAPAWLFTSIIAILTGWGLYEVAAMTGVRNAIDFASLVTAGLVPALAVWIAPGAFEWLPALVFLGLAVLMAVVGIYGGAAASSYRLLLVVSGAIYVGATFPYFALLRNREDGVALTIFILLLVVATDSAAYFAGRSAGRRKLAPQISPNKTVEGAIGGLAGSVVAGLILWQILIPRWGCGNVLVIAIVISVLAQTGDLIGSALKRAAGVKDSGWIFPGHGGLLDRTCSLVFAVAFTYYYSR